MNDVSLAAQTSVIIVSYNSGSFLRDCVLSVLGTEPQVEIVLVDNDSADGAVRAVEAEFPTIKVIRSDRNIGFGAGNNLGANTRSDSIWFFSTTMQLLPKAGSMHSSYHLANPSGGSGNAQDNARE